MKLASTAPGPDPPTGVTGDSVEVTVPVKVKTPARWLSPGRRRFCARSNCAPHLMVWLPIIFVQLLTQAKMFPRLNLFGIDHVRVLGQTGRLTSGID